MLEETLIVSQLDQNGLEEFIKQYKYELCHHTINTLKVAHALEMDFDQVAIIIAPPDDYTKSSHLYDAVVRARVSPGKLIEALDKTNNEHVVEKMADLLKLPKSHGKGAIWFNVEEPIQGFAGREDFLHQLHQRFHNDNETTGTTLSQLQVISGLGGVGKTETARMYVQKYSSFYDHVVWINAQTKESLTLDFLKLAQQLGVSCTEGAVQKAVTDIYKVMCSDVGKSPLFVFDNAEDLKDSPSGDGIKPSLPHALPPQYSKPFILVTSRNRKWSDQVTTHSLPGLDLKSGVQFLMEQLKLDKECEKNQKKLEELVKLLDGLPLALNQAVSHLKVELVQAGLVKPHRIISKYIRNFKDSLRSGPNQDGKGPESEASPAVFGTWTLTLQQIERVEHGKIAIKIINILSLLYPDEIPVPFLAYLFSSRKRPNKHLQQLQRIMAKTLFCYHHVDPVGGSSSKTDDSRRSSETGSGSSSSSSEMSESDPQKLPAGFFNGLYLLEKYSMIRNDRGFITIHRMVQAVILQSLQRSNSLNRYLSQIVKKLKVSIETSPKIKSDPEGSALLLNMLHFVKNHLCLQSYNKKYLDLTFRFAAYLMNGGKFDEAQSLYQKVLEQRRNKLGENHRLTLLVKNDLALIQNYRGNYNQALEEFNQLYDVQKRVLGKNHKNTFLTQVNKALVCNNMGRNEESLQLSQQVLPEQKRHLRKNHSQTIATAFNLACTLRDLGNLQEALTLFSEVYEQRKKVQNSEAVFGVDSERRRNMLESSRNSVLQVRSQMGILMCDLGQYQQAQEIYEEVLKDQEKALPTNHVDLVMTRHNLAHIYYYQKRLEESLSRFLDVQISRRKIYGDNHPHLFRTENHLSLVLLELGRTEEAMDLLNSVWRRERENLGEDHPVVLSTKHNMSVVKAGGGDHEGALGMLKDVYERRKRVIGPRNPWTLSSLFHVAKEHQALGEFKEALEIFKQVYQMRAEVLGQSHPDTVATKEQSDICYLASHG